MATKVIFKSATITKFLSIRYWLVLTLLLPVETTALPEDFDQPILIDYNNSEFLLNEGKEMLYGSPDEPAVITQGTLKISGQAIIIERVEGEIKKVTVTGSPALYQQQPAIDQGLAIAEGNTIILDYDTQHMSAIGEVTFSQDSNVWSGCQVDYFIETRRLTTPLCENGERASAIIAPRNGQ